MCIAVWDVDVPVRLDDGQLQPPEGAVEQFTTGCLKTQQHWTPFEIRQQDFGQTSGGTTVSFAV